MKRTIIQTAAVIFLAVLCGLAFVLVAGDDDPRHPMSFFEFISLKLIGIAAIYGCYRFGIVLKEHDLIPEWVTALTKELSEDEE